MRWGLVIAALLLIAAAVLLAVANGIAPRTEIATYEKGLDAITQQLAANEIHSDKASRRFHALQNRHATTKWLLIDLGYLALALGVATAAFATLSRGEMVRQLTRSHSWKTTALLALTVALLLCAGGVASANHELARGLLPPWADAPAAAYADAAALAIMAFVFVAAVCLPPHALGRDIGASLFAISRPPFLVAFAANLIYFPLACIACFLAASYAQFSGAWLATPAFLLMAWLFLHARGVILAPPRSAGESAA